jgi:hypothetical protein
MELLKSRMNKRLSRNEILQQLDQPNIFNDNPFPNVIKLNKYPDRSYHHADRLPENNFINKYMGIFDQMEKIKEHQIKTEIRTEKARSAELNSGLPVRVARAVMPPADGARSPASSYRGSPPASSYRGSPPASSYRGSPPASSDWGGLRSLFDYEPPLASDGAGASSVQNAPAPQELVFSGLPETLDPPISSDEHQLLEEINRKWEQHLIPTQPRLELLYPPQDLVENIMEASDLSEAGAMPVAEAHPSSSPADEALESGTGEMTEETTGSKKKKKKEGKEEEVVEVIRYPVAIKVDSVANYFEDIAKQHGDTQKRRRGRPKGSPDTWGELTSNISTTGEKIADRMKVGFFPGLGAINKRIEQIEILGEKRGSDEKEIRGRILEFFKSQNIGPKLLELQLMIRGRPPLEDDEMTKRPYILNYIDYLRQTYKVFGSQIDKIPTTEFINDNMAKYIERHKLRSKTDIPEAEELYKGSTSSK